jgi:hypothetical protein
MLATHRLIDRDQASYVEAKYLGATLLHLSKEEHQNSISMVNNDGLMCHPVTGLGITLFHENPEELAARLKEEEDHRVLQQTLKLWATNILPSLKLHVSRLYSANFEHRRLEEKIIHDATPSERLAAEWLENSQVRCCMLATTLDNIVQSRINLAMERRRKWEKLYQQLQTFDIDDCFGDISPLVRLPQYLDQKKFLERRDHNVSTLNTDTDAHTTTSLSRNDISESLASNIPPKVPPRHRKVKS